MPRLRDNVLANYAGQFWIALMSVVFIPLYIHILGMEAFGLVGLMLSLQALSLLLDMGMGNVLNRELARRAHTMDLGRSMGDLVRTFEWLIWPAVVVIAIAVWGASDLLANHWLHPRDLSRAETAHVVTIMGVALALQWPSSFYSNGLSGLERQAVLNVVNAGFATLRGAGVVVVLYWVSPTITAFMWWYAAMGACQSLTSAAALWCVLPTNGFDASFRWQEIRASGRFAGGLLAITALSVALTQLDRIVLSTMRPLVDLGYFTLAVSVAAGLGRMVQPMFNALYPRYSRLVAVNDQKTLIALYHLSTQYLVVLIAAASAVLVLFSRDVIYLWTGDMAVASTVALTASILVVGSALNGLLNLPYALQLAYGWTRLTAGMNLIALIVAIPFSIWAVHHYGIVGAASLWFAINLGFVAIGVPLMHRRLLRGELYTWCVHDLMPPVIAATAIALSARWLFPTLTRDLSGFLSLLAISVATLLAAALSASSVRLQARQLLARFVPPQH
jgi:O-antigen/teichoic acid export membrane protein